MGIDRLPSHNIPQALDRSCSARCRDASESRLASAGAGFSPVKLGTNKKTGSWTIWKVEKTSTKWLTKQFFSMMFDFNALRTAVCLWRRTLRVWDFGPCRASNSRWTVAAAPCGRPQHSCKSAVPRWRCRGRSVTWPSRWMAVACWHWHQTTSCFGESMATASQVGGVSGNELLSEWVSPAGLQLIQNLAIQTDEVRRSVHWSVKMVF